MPEETNIGSFDDVARVSHLEATPKATAGNPEVLQIRFRKILQVAVREELIEPDDLLPDEQQWIVDHEDLGEQTPPSITDGMEAPPMELEHAQDIVSLPHATTLGPTREAILLSSGLTKSLVVTTSALSVHLLVAAFVSFYSLFGAVPVEKDKPDRAPVEEAAEVASTGDAPHSDQKDTSGTSDDVCRSGNCICEDPKEIGSGTTSTVPEAKTTSRAIPARKIQEVTSGDAERGSSKSRGIGWRRQAEYCYSKKAAAGCMRIYGFDQCENFENVEAKEKCQRAQDREDLRGELDDDSKQKQKKPSASTEET